MCVGIAERHRYVKPEFANPVVLDLTPLDDAADGMVVHLTEESKRWLTSHLAESVGVPPGHYYGLMVMIDRDALTHGNSVYRESHSKTISVVPITNLDRVMVLAIYADVYLRDQVRKDLFAHCNSSYGEIAVHMH